MAVFSTIPFTQLERAKRIDGEYYQPKYLALGELHKRGQWLPIRRYLDLCEYGISIKMNEDGDGHKIFRMEDLKNGFVFDNEMKYAPIPKTTFEKFRLEPNDILFNRVNSEEFVGRTGIFKLGGDYVFASYLVRLRANVTMSPAALNLFLNSKYGVLSIRRLSRRAVNQANVNAQELQSILMPRFSPEIQNALAQCSNSSWEFFAEAERLYTQAQQLLLSALGLQNWKPPHTLAYVRNYSQATRARRMDAEHFQPKYAELFSIIKAKAKYWRHVKELRVFNARGSQPIYLETGTLSVINSRHILEQQLDYDNFELTAPQYWDLQREARVLKHDVLIYTTGANVGRTNIYLEDEKALASNHVNILRLREENPVYVGFVLNSVVGRLQTRELITGTAQAELYPSHIDQFLVPFIAPDKQIQIASLVQQAYTARRKAKTISEKAKRAVELAIEEGEDKAMDLIG